MDSPASLRCPVCGIEIDTENPVAGVQVACDSFGGKKICFCSENCRRHFQEDPRIAYFSMEIGVSNSMPTYSGGLGVLAGDIVKSSADLRLQMVAITLASRKGYFRQKITGQGEQLEFPDEWDPAKTLSRMPNTVTVSIEGRPVQVQAWLYEYQSITGGMVPILFLDTDIEGNAPEDRRITDSLYGGDKAYRLKQEIVLGIAGTRLLKKLPFKIRKYHMNEGHSSLLTLELLKENGMDSEKVRNLCVFTTHSPVEAAFDQFSYDLVKQVLGNEYSRADMEQYAGTENLNMAFLAVNLSKYINGVSMAHVDFSRKLFPGRYIRAVTNGVHSFTWTNVYFRQLFDKYIPGWTNEPILLAKASEIPNREVWDAHTKAKANLLAYVEKANGVTLDPEALTIGFARRATGYKRSTLIFSDLHRLADINRKEKIQMIFAGKAHPKDTDGKQLIKQIHDYANKLKDQISIVYLENYNMDIAAKLTSGVDVWLNTPLPPLEASGTSGMKAAHNGVVNFSVLDGWWMEGCIEGVTGWAIGPHPKELLVESERRELELQDLYSKLEYLIIPTFYTQKDAWITLMKNSIAKIAYYFQTQWVVRRYITEAYLI
ncbi:MAG: alpha-glucan family phosphorylase [Candidatus Bathyarchaeia archaeon]